MIVFLTAFCGLSLADVERMTLRSMIEYATAYNRMMGFDKLDKSKFSAGVGTNAAARGKAVSLDDPDAVSNLLGKFDLL